MKAIEHGRRVELPHCPRTWKLCFSHRQARAAIRRLNDFSMSTYRCQACGFIHIGHKVSSHGQDQVSPDFDHRSHIEASNEHSTESHRRQPRITRQDQRNSRSRRKSHSLIRGIANGCAPNCEKANDGLLLRCQGAGCSTVITLPEGPDEALPGVEINEHGIVSMGYETITVPVSKGFKCEFEVCEVQKDRWHFGYDFQTRIGGRGTGINVGEDYFSDRLGAIEECVHRAISYFNNNSAEAAAKTVTKWWQEEYQRSKPELEESTDSEAAASDVEDEPRPSVMSLVNGQIAVRCHHCRQYNNSDYATCWSCKRNVAPERSEDRTTTADVPLRLIEAHPENPRQNLFGLEDLAESLKSQGQLVEALGRHIGPEDARRVQLIAGHRRFAAAKLAGLATLRVRILSASDEQAIEIMGRDNEERENFDGIARGRWYQSMLTALRCTQKQLADRIGKSQPDIANHLSLLKLPSEWQAMVIGGEISTTMARELTPHVHRSEVLSSALQLLQIRPLEDWTSRAWAEAIRQLTKPESSAGDPIQESEEDLASTDSADDSTESLAQAPPADKGRSKKLEAYRRQWLVDHLKAVVEERSAGLSSAAIEGMLREADASIERDWVPDRDFFMTLKKTEIINLMCGEWADIVSDELKQAARKMNVDEIIEDLETLDLPLPRILK